VGRVQDTDHRVTHTIGVHDNEVNVNDHSHERCVMGNGVNLHKGEFDDGITHN